MSEEAEAAGGGGGSWVSMNENLMELLEAVLRLAASSSDSSPSRPARPAIKPGGHSEDIFVDLSEEELNEFSCSICYQVLKETMQCMNQHKFCHSCLYVWSTTGQYANRVRCPVCRCQGYYFRNDDLDQRINKKRARCSLPACQWVGPLKLLTVHRHTNYSRSSAPAPASRAARDSSDEEEEEAVGSVFELPFLGRAPPVLPHRSQGRFRGTGLQARSVLTPLVPLTLDPDDPTIQVSTSTLERGSVGGGGGVLLRVRRNAGTSTEPPSDGPSGPARPPIRQRARPVRRASRISVSHTDNNNNLPSSSVSAAVSSDDEEPESPRRPSLALGGSLTSPRQPRPPSAPRPTNQPTRRNAASTAAAPTGRQRVSSPIPTGLVIRAPPTFNSEVSASRSSSGTGLNAFHNRLQQSRDRLEGLMSNFSTELERSRQEMADFQVERERQRREQLTEVRELGRRLGQVASELRILLNHRRVRPSESDD